MSNFSLPLGNNNQVLASWVSELPDFVCLVYESFKMMKTLRQCLELMFPDLFILGKLVSTSFSEGQATGVAGTSLAHNQADVASVA